MPRTRVNADEALLLVAGYNGGAPIAIVVTSWPSGRNGSIGHFDMAAGAAQVLDDWQDQWREARRGVPWVTIHDPADRHRYRGVALSFDGQNGFNFESSIRGEA